MFLSVAMQAGRSLDKLEADHRTYYRQMIELKRKSQTYCCALTFQVILNLRHQCDDHTRLTGEAMDEDEMVIALSRPGYGSVLRCFYAWKMILFAVFGEHERGADLAIAEGDAILEAVDA